MPVVEVSNSPIGFVISFATGLLNLKGITALNKQLYWNTKNPVLTDT